MTKCVFPKCECPTNGFDKLCKAEQASSGNEEIIVKKYKSAKEFINDLMDNEGAVFADAYGRYWKYERYEFSHKDLGDETWNNGLFCLHLHDTGIRKL